MGISRKHFIFSYCGLKAADRRGEAVEEAFCSVILHTEESEKWKLDHNINLLKNLIGSMQKDALDVALKTYVSRIYQQKNGRRIDLLLDLLEFMIENNILRDGTTNVKHEHFCKMICESLLSSDHLSYQASVMWIKTFHYIRKVIGGVDYKGCRDLLKLVLEKCTSIPVSENVCVMPRIECVLNLITYILDRNACLLPAYLAVNEITKICPEDRKWPHWKMGTLLSDFIHSFRPAAQMVTVSGRCHLLPVVGHSLSTNNVWRLSSNSLKFPLIGPLPYDKELSEPQTRLLRYVLEQPYSRDMVCNMLGLNKQIKQRCEVLEEQLVDLVVMAMERSENDDATSDEGLSQLLWQHLSSQVIYFVLFQFASFPHMVLSLYEKLKGRNLNKGRDHLMWVLLQFISGSIQKNPLKDFLPVMKLYDLLYSDDQTIPVPDINKAQSTHGMASTCIWIHLNKKAQTDKVVLPRPIPFALQEHLEYLKECLNNRNLSMSDYKIALLCNAYSTNNEYFNLPLAKLVESIYGDNKHTTLLPGNLVASAPTQPLPMSLLDSLTVHAKMSLIHGIVHRVIRQAKAKTNIANAPALVETYSRLLVYMEIESLGIKGFISQLLPTVLNSSAWGMLHTLLEMFSYRLHHTQPHYRVQLLGHLHTLSTIPHTNQNQLHLCVESTALRLIIGLGSFEVQPQLSRLLTEPSRPSFLSNESEELNRALVLTLSRAMHVTGVDNFSSSWFREILSQIMQSTPHNWPTNTLVCFPSSLAEFFTSQPAHVADKKQLRHNVETEYKKWKSLVNESDIIAHFSMQGSSPLFLCILWKNMLEENRVPSTAHKVLDRLGPRALSAHLRTFADYMVFELNNTGVSGQYLNKSIDTLNEMVWRYNIVPIDRLVLCLALRNFDETEARLCFLIIHMLLLKPQDFKMRVQEFVRENSPEHWLQSNWHEKHMAFHRKYPEKFYYEGIQDLNSPIQHQYLPIYFGNVCLRFLPVLDILLHRIIEQPTLTNLAEKILESLGILYKFHDHPITYLYNTLHYYHKLLIQKTGLKRRLVQTIMSAHQEIRPSNWFLSEDYQRFIQEDNMEWSPSLDYYVRLVGRLVDTINGKSPSPFPNCDWRFNEFPSPAAHALYVTCVELMALPTNGATVGGALLEVVLRNCTQLPREKIMSWMNAVGLLLTALPDTYWMSLNTKIAEVVTSPPLTIQGMCQPFQLFNFTESMTVLAEQNCTYLLALSHAVWHHAGIGQLSQLPQFLRETLKPIIKKEEQFLYLCHLVGPFLQRLNLERTRCLMELVVELYEILVNVDKSCDHLNYIDPIADFLYHIKYMFVGDSVKNDVEKIIRNFRQSLQIRMRFISHINIEEAMTPLSAPMST
ncbi:hypothetical protein FSP39_009382 [Pinctada imbricata]|uniref:Mediator of RNA polymerase II transcription subunit 23 n=1 Tax=Pinctada imbricata TaxID=66713 RepID=A0AA88XR68_PINIB|nr:hypothetical protein FSP39_009382 [Pinctada imbricata]